MLNVFHLGGRQAAALIAEEWLALVKDTVNGLI